MPALAPPLVGHTDDGDAPAAHQALSTVETVPLRQVRSVSLTQVASHADRYARGESSLAEAWLSVGWSTVRRVELEPAERALALICRTFMIGLRVSVQPTLNP